MKYTTKKNSVFLFYTTPTLGAVSSCMTSATCAKINIAVNRLTACYWQVALYIILPFTFTEEERDNI